MRHEIVGGQHTLLIEVFFKNQPKNTKQLNKQDIFGHTRIFKILQREIKMGELSLM